MDDPTGPRKTISPERKITYYIGLALIIIGFLTFFSIFLTVAQSMGQPMMIPGGPGFPDGSGMPDTGSFAMRAVLGIGLIILGGVLMSVGSRGLAGSGVLLDPNQAREDLEPWSRMAGGIAKDALDEADISLGSANDSPDPIPFDEKLRRLEKLRAEGLLSEAEFQQKRAEILGEKW